MVKGKAGQGSHHGLNEVLNDVDASVIHQLLNEPFHTPLHQDQGTFTLSQGNKSCSEWQICSSMCSPSCP